MSHVSHGDSSGEALGLTLGHYPKKKPFLKPSVFSVVKHIRWLRKRKVNPVTTAKHPLPFLQRCSVRFTYSRNRGQGFWRAHGQYLAREGGHQMGEKALGFHVSGEIPIGQTLAHWEETGDKHLFKLILSPEFGNQLDLQQLTCDFMNKLSHDLDKSLEWVAIDHYNTEHPHVHIALRGHDASGASFRIPRDYIKTTMRQRAQEMATIQLGVRTPMQVRESLERQVNQKRFTDLDRLLLQNVQKEEQGLCVDLKNELKQLHKRYRTALLMQRLEVLKEMGLAHLYPSGKWVLANDAETILRQYQMQNDRLKMMYQKTKHAQHVSELVTNLALTSSSIHNPKKKVHELIQSI